MSPRVVPDERLKAQLRAARPYPAESAEDVICCGHDLTAHDDDGCTVGWHPADERSPDGCPCRIRGWAS